MSEEHSSNPKTKKQKTDEGRTSLQYLMDFTTIVADSGDLDSISKFKPQDATTNPSLILKAAKMPEYSSLVEDAILYGKGDVNITMDKLSVNFGEKLTKIVPGFVSTEVDARLSFDTEATIRKAKQIIELYKEVGVDKSRILIKIAATWEGIKAAQTLEKDGITCNLTLIFSKAQAIACAEAQCTLISPFVGRIMDWYKNKDGVSYQPSEDPGVLFVTEIYNYYKKYGYATIVMGASFRNVEEILELAGCDRLTISPSLLEKLDSTTSSVAKKLDIAKSKNENIERVFMNEKTFRWMMNENIMATEKLGEGIRNFAADIVKLENIVKLKIQNGKPYIPIQPMVIEKSAVYHLLEDCPV